tara:strand:- start:4330 stop:4533 length:204 start_codon:yes stop_codon:yes gene_type:complete
MSLLGFWAQAASDQFGQGEFFLGDFKFRFWGKLFKGAHLPGVTALRAAVELQRDGVGTFGIASQIAG